MSKNEIDVSVYMVTYYHESYIRQAIDSVIMQKTKYSYEIVISDDCSKDKTVSIIKEYIRKYPGLIRLYVNSENKGIPENIYNARIHCKGKVIVGLAGDDYWIDKYKIEKQAGFLFSHPEYYSVGTVMELRYDFERKPFKILPPPKERNCKFTLHDYELGKTLYTHGFMFRNEFVSAKGRAYYGQAKEISNTVDDAVDNVLMLMRGKAFVLNEVTDVYRVPRDKTKSHNYNSRYSRYEKRKQTIDLYNCMAVHFGNKLNLKRKYVKAFAICLLDMYTVKKIRLYYSLYRTIPINYRKPFYKSVFIQSIPESIKFVINRIRKNN